MLLVVGLPGRLWRARRRICRAILCWPCALNRGVRAYLAAAELRRRRAIRQAQWRKLRARLGEVRASSRALSRRATSFASVARVCMC